MKFGYIVDPHFNYTGPASRIDNYALTSINKFSFVCDYLLERNIFNLFLSGDLLSHSHNTDEYMNQLIDLFRFYKRKGLKIFSIIGNHDSTQTTMDTFKQRQCGTLFSAGCFNLLDNEEVDGIKFQGFSAYQPNFQIQDCDVLMIHHFIGASSDLLWVNVSDLKRQNPNLKMILAGHDHISYPVTDIDGVRIVRPGSMMRVNSDPANNRTPQFSIIDTYDYSVKNIPIPCQKYEDIFLTEVKDIVKEEDVAVNQFIEKFNSINTAYVDITDIIQETFNSVKNVDLIFTPLLVSDIQSEGYVLKEND